MALSDADKLAFIDYWERALQSPRSVEDRRLLRHGAKIYSENDEDGILQEIFRRIGATKKRFIEFGVKDAKASNTTLLLCCGWSGLWLEANASLVKEVERQFAPFLQRLICKSEWITTDNVNDLLPRGAEVDLLSIGLDYNGYWIWKALEVVKPRVVVVKYNASLKPPLSLAVPYEADRSWDGTSFFGASLTALEALGKEKRYSLVGCCFSGVNAFFVRDDLVGRHFCTPYTAENHYEPPRYFMRYPRGHEPGIGPYVAV